MKIYIKLLSILFLFTFFGCTTSGNGSSSSSQDENEIILAKDLPYHIDKIGRLSVQGTGSSIRVVDTSTPLVMGDTRPIFVMDGIQMGRELSHIMQILNSQEQVTVHYLTTRLASIRYGEAGKWGAVLINRVSQN